MKAVYRSMILKDPKIKISGKEHCVFCKKAKALLEQNNLDFEWDEVSETFPYDTVPQIWLGKTHIGGFRELNDVVNAILPTR